MSLRCSLSNHSAADRCLACHDVFLALLGDYVIARHVAEELKRLENEQEDAAAGERYMAHRRTA